MNASDELTVGDSGFSLPELNMLVEPRRSLTSYTYLQLLNKEICILDHSLYRGEIEMSWLNRFVSLVGIVISVIKVGTILKNYIFVLICYITLIITIASFHLCIICNVYR